MIGPKEKKERALGVKLFLKGERCNSPKCAMVRRPYKPGPHGKTSRGSRSEFAAQLLEKQKIMFSYGLRDNQLKRIFQEAISKKEAVRGTIVKLLETRLDNTLFRSGFAPSRITARQYVSHGHILVNDKKVTIPSYRVKPGDVISIKPSSKELLIFKDLPANIKKYEAPEWLSLDKGKVESRVKSWPSTEDMTFDINVVVDYYSR